jgi:hypothetical protein
MGMHGYPRLWDRSLAGQKKRDSSERNQPRRNSDVHEHAWEVAKVANALLETEKPGLFARCVIGTMLKTQPRPVTAVANLCLFSSGPAVLRQRRGTIEDRA